MWMRNINLTAEIFYLPLFMATLPSGVLLTTTYSTSHPAWHQLINCSLADPQPQHDSPVWAWRLAISTTWAADLWGRWWDACSASWPPWGPGMRSGLRAGWPSRWGSSWRDGDQQGHGGRQLQTKWASSWWIEHWTLPAKWGMGETLLRCWREFLVTL